MAVINKAPERMSSRERVLRTFAHEKTDRVPIGYDANPGVDRRFREALGAKDWYELADAIGMDCRAVGARYIGRPLFPELPDRKTDPIDGFHTRYVKHRSGGYEDFCDFPLAGAEPEQLDAYPIPDPDDFDYDDAARRFAIDDGRALFIGGAGTGDVINSLGRMMGMENILINLITGDEATLRLIARRADSQLGVLERLLDKNPGKVDFMWLGEDLGTQIAPMISKELYRSALKPTHKKFVDLAKSRGLPVIVHTCGSSSWAYEDFIEMGVDAVDTLQPEAANMSPEYLKKTFGTRLGYRGCISTAGPLAFGTPEEVDACVRDTLKIMMEGGGYHFAPTHAIQDNTPTENVIAMYNAAHRYGVYE